MLGNIIRKKLPRSTQLSWLIKSGRQDLFPDSLMEGVLLDRTTIFHLIENTPGNKPDNLLDNLFKHYVSLTTACFEYNSQPPLIFALHQD